MIVSGARNRNECNELLFVTVNSFFSLFSHFFHCLHHERTESRKKVIIKYYFKFHKPNWKTHIHCTDLQSLCGIKSKAKTILLKYRLYYFFHVLVIFIFSAYFFFSVGYVQKEIFNYHYVSVFSTMFSPSIIFAGRKKIKFFTFHTHTKPRAWIYLDSELCDTEGCIVCWNISFRCFVILFGACRFACTASKYSMNRTLRHEHQRKSKKIFRFFLSLKNVSKHKIQSFFICMFMSAPNKKLHICKIENGKTKKKRGANKNLKRRSSEWMRKRFRFFPKINGSKLLTKPYPWFARCDVSAGWITMNQYKTIEQIDVV